MWDENNSFVYSLTQVLNYFGNVIHTKGFGSKLVIGTYNALEIQSVHTYLTT